MSDLNNDDDSQQQQNALDGNWYDSLAGEDEGRIEQLSQYDSADAFFEAHNSALNRDWRAEIAGDDDKFKSKLERFADPGAFGTAYREAEQKIRAGDIGPTVPGEEATDEEIKAYRTEIGIPLEAEGYLKDLPDGLVIGEEDKELVDEFIGDLHEIHAPTAFVHRALQWYDGLQERMQEAEQELDLEQSREATDALRDPEEGWGKDFRTNMEVIKGFLKANFGEESAEQLMNGRYGDGRGFFNDPKVLMGLAAVARKINPVDVIIPNDTNQVAKMNDRIAELEGMMGNKQSDYWKQPKLQQELRDLYDARSKLEEQNAA